jgi:hypothetical protein
MAGSYSGRRASRIRLRRDFPERIVTNTGTRAEGGIRELATGRVSPVALPEVPPGRGSALKGRVGT